MTTLPDLVPPWSSIPLVNDDTRLFPEPTMTAVAAAVTEAVVSSPELSATIGEKVQPVANDVVASAVTAQDIPGKVATATSAAITDADIPALVTAEAPAIIEAATPDIVTAEVALRVPPAVDTAITGADIPGKVAIALAAQAGKILQGTGMPNGVVTAGVGTLYVDTANTMGASIWRKASGIGSTGWTVVEGDTGERDVSASLVHAGLAKSSSFGVANIRRVGNRVSAVFRLDVSASAITEIYSPPLGFRTPYVLSRPGTAYSAAVAGSSIPNDPISWYLSSASGIRTGALPNPGSISIDATWLTRQDWPTSLPGTSA